MLNFVSYYTKDIGTLFQFQYELTFLTSVSFVQLCAFAGTSGNV